MGGSLVGSRRKSVGLKENKVCLEWFSFMEESMRLCMEGCEGRKGGERWL